MALFRRFFYRKPPDRLLEISERLYVFDCCLSNEVLEEDEYKVYMGRIAAQLQDYFPDASFMAFNFREGKNRSQTSDILSSYGMTVMDYPQQYEGCPLLPLEMIHHFLKSSESWLTLEGQQNVLLMHCERGGWPVLAFMLAGLLLYRKQYSGEQRTLEMVFKQAPRELLHLLSPLNSKPSQMRYLQYISRRNLSTDWPPSDTTLVLDCLILRVLPFFEGGKGCRPVVRIYGQDPSTAANRRSKLLFSTSKMKKKVCHYAPTECMMVKMDIHCRVQGDVVLECIHMDDALVREEMMFRIVFHTAFIQANILMLSRDEVDVLWDAKDQIPRDFKAEVLFMDADAVVPNLTTYTSIEDENDPETASPEEFFEVEEIFTSVLDAQEGKGEIDSSLQVSPSNNEEDHKEVWKEDADPHAFLDCAPDDWSLKQELKVDSNIDAVKDIVVDDVQYRNDEKQGQVKDIAVDDGTIRFKTVAFEKVLSKDKDDEQEKHEDVENGHPVEDTTTKRNLDLEILQQNLNDDIRRQKPEKSLPSPPDKGASIILKSSADSVPRQMSNNRVQESQATNGIQVKPNVIQQQIPLNKGSLTNSMCMSYPPSRYNSSPAALALTSPKEPNLGVGLKSLAPVAAPRAATPTCSLPKLSSQIKEDSTKTASLVKEDSPTSTSSQSCPNLQKKVAPTLPPAPPSLDPPPPSSPPSPPLPPSPLPQSSALSLAPASISASIVSPPLPSPPSLCRPSSGMIMPLPPSSPSWKHVTSSLASLAPPPLPPLPPYSNVTYMTPKVVPPTPPPPPPPLPLSSLPTLSYGAPPPSPPPPPTRGTLPPPLSSPSTRKTHPPPSPQPPLTSTQPSRALPSPPPPPPMHGTLRSSSVLPLPPPPTIGVEARPPTSISGPPPPPPLPSLSGALFPPSTPTLQGVLYLPSLLRGCPTLPPLRGGPPSPPGAQATSPPSRVPPSPPPPLSPPHGNPFSPLSSSRAPPPPPLPSRGAPLPPPPSGKVPLPPPPPAGTSCGGPSPPPIHGACTLDPPGGRPLPPPFRAKATCPPSPSHLGAGRGQGLSQLGMGSSTPRRSSLKPLHWSKVTRALQGSLWDELQRFGGTRVSEFDVSELETLFSANVPKPVDGGKVGGRRKSVGSKTDKVHLIDVRRANNTEIMLTKVKMPLPVMMAGVLAMDESVLDVDQVENLIKVCPTKEEMELLKNYTGDKENLGKCEQCFLELMKVPRVELKLRVFSFKIQFGTQVSEFRKSLNTVNSACEEVRNSYKFKEIMKIILFLGNVLNQGTARGSAIGFKLDSLLKLTDTRATNNKMTLMHFLCKKLSNCCPELLDFHQDLFSLEAASKTQLKSLAEEMQAIIKGLEKVKQELAASENDGPVSEVFGKTLKGFIGVAEAEVESLINLYQVVGRNADSLVLYFNEDPARCPFEQVTVTLLNFVRLFRKSHEENSKQAEQEKKKAERDRDGKGKGH